VNHLAYPRRGSASFLTAGALALAALGALGCQAGVKASNNGSGGSGSGQGGSGASGGSTGTGGRVTNGSGGSGSGSGGSPVDAGFNPDAMACQTKDYQFLPQIPDVYVLVDRSGSEFDQSTCSSTTMSYTGGNFFTLKTAVLQVMQNLQDQVRFGFGSFVGEHPNGGACQPDLTPAPSALPFDLYNYNAINAIYGPLGSLSPCGAKADTPAIEVLPMIKSALLAEPATATNPMTNATYSIGNKYLLFVTDSETDFCDDGEALCPADAMTWGIQDLYKSGIGTLVIGLPVSSSVNTIAASVLQNFANAGAGQPVAPVTGTTQLQAHNDCQGVTGYVSAWNQANPGQNISTDQIPIATYSATGGNATVFAPTSASDVQALSDQITAAIQGVKSCTFDLTGFKIDLTMLSRAGVLINGAVVPLDPNNGNGWDMVSGTELQLFGPACDNWRKPSSTDIKFDFPCDLVITIDKP
jgi:hypothetical protein